MTTAPDIFLSYNREDQAIARRFAEAFEGEGFRVWWDTTLRAGEAYDEVTEQALRTAKAVVVLWSPRSVVSRWVRAEATLADRNRTLVPCTIEPCDRPIMFELTQTAELSHWKGEPTDKAWQAFLGDVRQFVGKEAPADPVQATQPAAPPLPTKPSIAVLPFADMSSATEEDYFAEGMVQEISAALSRFPSLFVIDSGSTLTYRSSGLTPRQIARELGVQYVLDGSVRRSGPRVRISTQLVDTLEGEQIWAERFDGTLEDVFALQDTVANAVAGQIEPTIEAAEIRRAHSRPTESLRAYDLYLRALHLQRKLQGPSVREAIALLGKALELDPDYALAAGLAGACHMSEAIFSWSEDVEDSKRTGMALVRRSLLLSPDDPNVNLWAAYAFLFFENDWATAEDLAERGLARTPGSSFAWHVRGWVNLYTDRPEAALADFQKAIRLDPRAPDRFIIVAGVGWALFFLRRLEEAITSLRHARQIGPGNRAPIMPIAAAQAHLGRIAEARATIESLPSDWPYATWLKTFREEPQREFLRSGLALAGADV